MLINLIESCFINKLKYAPEELKSSLYFDKLFMILTVLKYNKYINTLELISMTHNYVLNKT